MSLSDIQRRAKPSKIPVKMMSSLDHGSSDLYQSFNIRDNMIWKQARGAYLNFNQVVYLPKTKGLNLGKGTLVRTDTKRMKQIALAAFYGAMDQD
jgi:hypothetical protein